MTDDKMPWLLPSKVKGQHKTKIATSRDPEYYQALIELSVAETKRWGRKVGTETIQQTLATKEDAALTRARKWLDAKTKQLKREQDNGTKYMDIKTKHSN